MKKVVPMKWSASGALPIALGFGAEINQVDDVVTVS